VVEKGSNVVNKERIQELRDLFLVRKVQRSLVRDPDTLQMHRANFDHMSNLFALQNAVSSPSGHTSHVEQLCSIDHVVIFATGNTDTTSLDLKAKTAFIFPQSGCYPRLHARGRVLTRGIKGVVRLHAGLTIHARQWENRLGARDTPRYWCGRGRCEAVPIPILTVGGCGTWVLVAWLKQWRLRMRIVAHGAGGDGLGWLRLPS